MKKIFTFLSLFTVVALAACDISVAVNPSGNPTPLSTNTALLASITPIPVTSVPTQVPASATSIPATVVPSVTSTVAQPTLEGVGVAVDPLNIVLSPAIASGARGIQFPRLDGENVAPWELTPGHIQLKLEGYMLQNKSQEPQILVYPAQGYAELFPAAFESMHRLNNILYDPAVPIGSEQLPRVPFFNAEQLFASNVQVISFQNGRGVRFLTEYAQYSAPANNADLFYHFQGLTSDGAYYIVAILPITAPTLADNPSASAVIPPGGVIYPDITNPGADMPWYYAAVTTQLNFTPAEAFAPSLNKLDLLVQSIRITP